jgi:hypothetical protein
MLPGADLVAATGHPRDWDAARPIWREPVSAPATIPRQIVLKGRGKPFGQHPHADTGCLPAPEATALVR